MAENSSIDEEKKQQVKKLTSEMVHYHYCSNKIQKVIDFLEPPFLWIGTGEQEYSSELTHTVEVFSEFTGHIPPCEVFDEEYDVICLAEHVYICTGKMWISTHPSTGMSLRVHQRITTVWKQSDEGFRCHHIHISNPYSEMEPSDVGFPEKMGKFSREYLQKQIDLQKKLIAEQTEQLKKLSFEDSLTGLFNRNKFTMLVNSEPVETAQTEPLGVAYFDLNGLKEVNDRFGHKAGDNFIIRVAKHIKKHFPQEGFRIGGDEFLIICREGTEQDFYHKIDLLSQDMTLDNISSAKGISWRSENCNLQEQFDEADQRMYEDKKNYYTSTEHDRRQYRTSDYH